MGYLQHVCVNISTFLHVLAVLAVIDQRVIFGVGRGWWCVPVCTGVYPCTLYISGYTTPLHTAGPAPLRCAAAQGRENRA